MSKGPIQRFWAATKWPGMWWTYLAIETTGIRIRICCHQTTLKNLVVPCHTQFQKEDQMYQICALGSSFTHMEDVISEYIKYNVQQRKQKGINTLLHTPIDRHEGLNVSPITYTKSSAYLHKLPQEHWLVNAPRTPHSHWSTPLHCSLLNNS